MAVVKNMMVRAGADFSAITTESKKAAASMQNMAGGISKSASTIKKALGAIGVGFSVAAIVRAAKDAAEAYDKQMESEVKLAQVMRNTMKASNAEIQSILDLASAQQKLGVVGDDATIAGAQQLSMYLHMSDSLETLIPVMNDLAVQQHGFNVTAEQTASVATLIGKAMNGQTGALTRMGIAVDDATAKILKYGSETERAAAVADLLSARVGGMNQALANTPTGRMKQLANAVGDIKESFGQAVRTLGTVFLPVLNTVAKILAAVATLANKVAQAIANVFGGKAAGKEWQFIPATAVTAVDDAADATKRLTDSTQQAAEAAREANEEFQQASFDTLHILQENNKESGSSGRTPGSTATAGPGDDSGGEIQEITTAGEEAGDTIGWLENLLGKLKEKWEDFKSGLDVSKLKDALGKLKEAFAPLMETLGKGFEWVWENVLKPLGQWTINEIAPRLVEALANAFKLVQAVLEVLGPIIDAVWPFFKWLAEIAGFAITAALDELNHALEMMTKAISGNLTDLERFQVFLQTLATISLAGIIGGLGGLGSAIGTAATAGTGLAGILGSAVGGAGMAGVVGTTAAGAAAGGLLGLLTSGGGAAATFGGAITGSMVPALGAGTAAAGTATAAAGALSAPVLVVVAAVVALGVAIYECIKHWDEIKDAARRAVDAIKTACSGIADWFRSNVKDPLVRLTDEIIDAIKKIGTDAMEGVRQKIAEVKGKVNEALESIRETGSRAWNAVKEFGVAAWTSIEQTWSRAKNFFDENIFQPLVSSAQKGVQKIKQVFENVAQVVSNAVQNVKNAIKKVMEIGDKLPSFSIRDTFTSVIDKIKNITLPGFAEGAVIPPRRQFTAVLGDQTSGLNIETPERLLRQIMHQELLSVGVGESPGGAIGSAVRDGSSTGTVVRLLDQILEAVLDGREIVMDGYTVGRTAGKNIAMQQRAFG